MARVSVITAAYNSAKVIERNIRCVGTQSLKPVEHIIVDDGSTDGTVEIVRALKREFPHLRLIQQDNGGAAAARNAGIAMATGRYVAFLDSDDYWSEHKLRTQITFMANHGIPFSYGDYDAIDANTGTLVRRHQAPDRVTYRDLLRGCPIGCLTAAFDLAMLGKRYMPDVRRGQDWGFWLALTRDGTVAHRYPGLHAFYHRSKNSLSSGKIEKIADIYRIYREHEGIGTARSMCYMSAHIKGALTKRRRYTRRPAKAAGGQWRPVGVNGSLAPERRSFMSLLGRSAQWLLQPMNASTSSDDVPLRSSKRL
jgi:glycosyltransferase involved in cell wall biosynthesis